MSMSYPSMFHQELGALPLPGSFLVPFFYFSLNYRVKTGMSRVFKYGGLLRLGDTPKPLVLPEKEGFAPPHFPVARRPRMARSGIKSMVKVGHPFWGGTY
jgi:hypothetical protein